MSLFEYFLDRRRISDDKLVVKHFLDVMSLESCNSNEAANLDQHKVEVPILVLK